MNVTKSNHVGVSVVVCCYNSALRIRETIRHLALQQVDASIEWEVLLVDNNCSDATVELALEEWGTYEAGCELKVLSEAKPGLSFAREAGVRAAQYNFLIYCDDDNWLAPDYVEVAYRTLQEHPDVGAVGGRATASSDIDLPHWFSTYQGKYAVGVQGLHSGDVTDRGFVWGAGIVLRRNVLLQFFDNGFTLYCSGRKGDNLMAGDDTEICCWFILAGYKLWYSDSLRFQHYIPQQRLTIAYLNEMQQGFKAASEYLKYYRRAITQKHRKKRSKLQRVVSAILHLSIFCFFCFLSEQKAQKSKLKFLCLCPDSKVFSSKGWCTRHFKITGACRARVSVARA